MTGSSFLTHSSSPLVLLARGGAGVGRERGMDTLRLSCVLLIYYLLFTIFQEKQ